MILNTKLFSITIICTMATLPIQAADEICGVIATSMGNHILETTGAMYYCKDGSSNVNLTSYMPTDTDPDKEQIDICVTYDTKLDSSTNIGTLNGCKFSRIDRKCAITHYLMMDTCYPCGGGTWGSVEEHFHKNTWCNYCEDESYYMTQSTQCIKCPCKDGSANCDDSERGRVATNGAKGIYSCFIDVPAGGSDETGQFIYTSDKCYYSEFTFWPSDD